jgi:hypothetical protein
VSIPEAAVKKTPEVAKEAEDSDPAETTGALAGGVLDIWEGLETASDPSKSGIERGGGAVKAAGGTSAVGGTVAKSLDAISDSTGDLAGTVTEACGFISSAAECIAAVRQAYDKGAWDAFMEFGKNLAGLVAGALKTAEAYAKFAEKSEAFKSWIAEGVIPALSIVSAATKAIQKVYELFELSTKRAALMKKLKTVRDPGMRSSTQHLVSMLDSKWYKGAIELASTTADLTGEAMKWAGWGVGWLTGSAVSASSKVLPLGAKIANYVWQTALDWGATRIIGGKTTLQVQGDTEALADMIVQRHTHAFGKLLCETIGIEQSAAGDKDAVLEALGALA